jgi:hypothetical protein
MTSAIATIHTAQVVDTRYTQDVIPVLDTSKFEHMQRIAIVMAKSSIIPTSLRIGKDEKNQEYFLPEEVVIANCFRIVNQAVRWGMDPFAVADCASIVHGRLMWEGKLVAAVIEAKLGVRPDYIFNDAAGQDLGVTVSAILPGENKPREIFGRVKDWHKGAKSPWANEGSWKRQLRYAGIREWARAYVPALLLGVYTQDELEGIQMRDVPSGQRALRMKEVEASKPKALELPDIPDIPAPADEIVNQDEPLGDAQGFLAKLEEDVLLCDSVEELAEMKEANADLIARLSPSERAKALKLFEAAE